jgi:hypothetical protein
MTSGSELVETWIPVGGFKVERRRVRTQDGGATVTECLVPKWEIDDLMEDYPCARQPCLHRLVADCSLEKAAVLDLAGRYGLLTVSLTRVPAPGKPVPSSTLSPEPLDIWKSEIRELKACADLWDRTAAGDRRGEEMLERKLGAGLAHAPFHLAASHENGSGFRMRYRPANLRAALWQRFAGEVAGLIRCARCPAPTCRRWFLKGEASRSDRQFCSDTCRVRAFRMRSADSLEHVTFRAPGER